SDPSPTDSALNSQLAALRDAERRERMRERIDVPPPRETPVDDAIDAAKRSAEINNSIPRTDPDPEPADDGVEPLELRRSKMGFPETAIYWLRQYPEYLTDPEKNQKLQDLHWQLIGEGHQGYSDQYFMEVDRRLHGAGAIAEEPPHDRLGRLQRELDGLDRIE